MSLSFSLKYFLISVIYFLTHCLFRNILFSTQTFRDLLVIFLLLISGLTNWSQRTFCAWFMSFKICWGLFWGPSIWLILINYLIYTWKKVLVTQSCPTLCNTLDYRPPGSSVHGILQARMLEWVAISSSNIHLRHIFLVWGYNIEQLGQGF